MQVNMFSSLSRLGDDEGQTLFMCAFVSSDYLLARDASFRGIAIKCTGLSIRQ